MVYTSYMGWMAIGAVVVLLLILFLALFFRSSGALNIAEEEQEEIAHESPEQIAKEVREGELEDIEALKAQEDEFYSHG